MKRFARERRNRRVAFISLLVPLTFVACGADPGMNALVMPKDLGEVIDLTGKPEVTVEVVDNLFTPQAFSVSAGTKITFVNVGASAHNVTPNERDAFTSIRLDPGASGSLTLSEAGAVPYYCTLHGTKTLGQRGAFLVESPKA